MLSPVHMSGDETDGNCKTHPRKFRIINARWQSAQLKAFLRSLDKLYRKDWENGCGRRAVPGGEPRVRFETPDSKSVNSSVPSGLWRNCYDDKWMGKQKEVFIEELCIIEEEYDFTISGEDADEVMTENIQEGDAMSEVDYTQ